MTRTNPVLAAVVLAWTAMPGLAAAAQMVELDHVSIVVPDRHAAVDRLVSIGFTVDSARITRYDGFGTATLAVLFEGTYLELLWVDSSVPVFEERRSDYETRVRQATWSADAPSPISIGLRRLEGAPDSLPYDGRWDGPDAEYFIFNTMDDNEPLIFAVPRDRAVPVWIDRVRRSSPHLFEHELGVRRLTRAIVHAAHVPKSVNEVHVQRIEFRESATPLVELTFDDGVRGRKLDLRPALPILVNF